MTTDTRTLTFERKIQAPAAELFRAFSNATALREWLSDVATVSPREGGRFYLAWNDGYYTSGTFTSLVPDEEVAFTWHSPVDPGPSAVRASLLPVDGGTRVLLEHSGLGAGPAWSETVSDLERAWPISLENLASVMETGEDLRFTRRPMLGITVSDFNADVAGQLGVPVAEGIRLDGVVSGMGAKAAGLQADDVLVSMAGRETVGWASLSDALASKQAGDTVEVVFYRGPEKHTAQMTLSGRPIPEIPETAQALAAALRERHAEIESELAAFFDGVSDAEAGYKP
ncbi:MAG: SRPBCC domain-containing protein, partial [Candidatus Promineifilaceae bacterium]|nr:SRPBCC domain-containing protein [Candidatus Promineifilaceae bacterium]